MNRRFRPGAGAIAAAALALLALPQLHAQEAGAALFQRYEAVAPTIARAAEEVEARHFEDAKRLLEPVLKQVPDHARAHFLLATMAYESRDFAGALDHIETSERSLKDLGRRYNQLVADMKAKDEAEARDVQASVDQLNASIATSNEAEAGGASDLFANKQAHLDYLKTKKMFNGEASFAVPSVYSFLHGNCLYRLGRASGAAAQYRLAIGSDPANAKAWNNLVNLYREGKDFDQARKTLAQAEAAGVAIQPGLKRSVLGGN
jgi:tetratricopeptide (TPR) repeat protein